ncbi:DEKNAAC103678 [Brettanomyces naardenensis]|uniref:Kinetochore protein Spc24 n=1 Tax=Brettanomyces naardenensis TaxID=13370 RepID=A0A448YP35_BRENA|nr:DEKNAAC103678 [Brettanomyces naardenensis]
MDLENRLFKIAGNLTTFNMELNSLKLTYNQDLKRLDELEDELSGLKNSFGLENSDDAVERAKIIKLKLYESTGLKLDPERREVLVLNKSANKTTVLKVNDNYSDYFISNYIWANI